MTRLRVAALAGTVLLVAVLVGWGVAGFFAAAPAAPPPAGARAIDGERIRVEVLNGAGVSGLAREATRRLRDHDFDVVYYGNASGAARDTSVVVDRVGRPGQAQRVADALGIGRVRSEPDTTLYLEATVVLGRDWDPVTAEQRAGGAERGLSAP